MPKVEYYKELFADKTYERLTPIEYAGKAKRGGHILWRFSCSCGNEIVRPAGWITSRKIVSCGCKRAIDMTGKTVGRLTVLRKTKSQHGQSYWICQCVCGRETSVQGTHLRAKSQFRTITCGQCNIGNESTSWSGFGELSGTHWWTIRRNAIRKSRTLEFTITIEQAWEKYVQQNGKCALTGWDISFDMHSKTRYKTTASLDRIDSEYGYTLDNIQWVHKDVNQLKGKLPEKILLELCSLVARYNV